jgi:hypothetical protein
LGFIASLGDYRAAPGMPDKQYRPILHLDRLLNHFDIVSK